MKLDRPSLRPFLVLSALLLALVACQNATDSNTNSDSPVVATASFPISAPRIPDSATWIFQKDTVGKSPSCPTPDSAGTTTCTESFHLPRSLGSDSVALRLWTLGIQTYTLYFKESGSSTTLDYGSNSVVSLDTLLLSKFADLTTAQQASFGKGPSALVAYYASLLLANDTAFAGKSLPVGMSPDSLKKDLVLLGISLGKTFAQLTALSPGLDTSSIRTIAAVLVQANLLKTTDTLDWFHPVRVNGAASLSGILTAGGSPANVIGAFAWNAGVQVTLSRISVRSPNPRDSANFQLSYQFNPGKTDTLWSLSGSVTLQALGSATAGWDTLVVTLSADATHSATLRIPFQVVAKDVTPPALTILLPARDTATVPNSTSTFVVQAVATDSGSGVDSLKIGTKSSRTAASIADTLWDTLSLVVGANVATVQAWDHAGNTSTQSVTVTRAPAPANAKAPTITHVSPSQDTETVPWGTKSSVLSWAIVGDTSIASVTVNGHALSGHAGLYQDSASLGVGPNLFALAAIDAQGLVAYDTLRITRQADTSHPLVSRGSGTDDTVLLQSQTSWSPVWTVTDNAMDSVTIDGIAATAGNGNTYSAPVPLSGDSLWITLVAKDSSGNTTRDSINVRRLGPPTITPTGGTYSGSQTPTAAITSVWPGAALMYSSDKKNWSPYSTALSISTSQIVYARASLGSVASDVDSAIFLFAPTLSPNSGPYPIGQVISIHAAGAVIEDSLSTGGGWVAYQSIQLTSSAVVSTRTRLGGAVSAVSSATYALPPKVSPVGGTFPDTVSVHAADSGADAFQWSSDGIAWKAASADTLRSSGTLYVRSVIGGIFSQPDTATFRISHDTSLLSLDVSGSKLGTAWDSSVDPGTLHLDSLPGFLQQLTVKAVPKDPFATETIDGSSTGTINLTNDTGTATVVVTNGPSTHTYLIHLCGRKLDTFTDSRDGHVYRAELFGTQWWMADNLESGSADGTYTWSQAMALPGSCDSTSCQNLIQSPHQGVCPTGWHVPVRAEWSALFMETMPPGATDSAIALKTDTGWTTISSVPSAYVPPTAHCNNVNGNCITTNYSNGTNRYSSFLIPFGSASIQNSVSPSGGTTGYTYANFWTPGELSPKSSATESFNYGTTSKIDFPVQGPQPLAPTFVPTALRCIKN